MDLQSFINETLTQISMGIRDSNEKLGRGEEGNKLFMLAPGQKKEGGAGIHFDVAITTQNIEEGSGGAKVKIAVVEANLGGNVKTSEQAVSRIQFSVTTNEWHG